ncbi:hypothetical protein CDL12_29492 [Handroanthus impetiginosus]|uniref:Retrovirus-related Pol polyprotein from transposon TNT 1-94-like beta-barrel domain-containing protein n=1 Tax=Handroanthus impetiginosus TaxID=429701 RepID=A0A2G9FYM7_9LAMI|nr:hypothetical protein CDL12_29492 [Handroanthus impetiginosus]
MEATKGEEDICLIDSGTTHTILKNKNYFAYLKLGEINVNTISGSVKLIEGSGRANVWLPEGTKLVIDNAIFSSKSRRNLLSFKDIRRNGYHIETMNDSNVEYLCIIINQRVIEKFFSFSSGIYYTKIYAIEMHHLVNQKFIDSKNFIIWHDRSGHPESIMMRRIIENSHGHSLKNQRVLKSNEFTCVAYSQEKFITKHSPMKVRAEFPRFL